MNTDTLELIRRAQSGDRECCGQLIQDNAGLIWSIARRYFGCGVDADDLYQLGCIGFIKAVQGFDAQYGTQFSTYAVPKISGEIRRFLRDDGSIKVSRGIKERAYAIKRTRLRLEQELGREPSVSEISADMGLTAEEIASTELAGSPPDSLQRQSGDDSFTLESIISSGNQEERILEKLALDEAVSALAPRERMLIALRYRRCMTQTDCAKIMGISQVQVSRLEKRIFEKLREKLSV